MVERMTKYAILLDYYQRGKRIVRLYTETAEKESEADFIPRNPIEQSLYLEPKKILRIKSLEKAIEFAQDLVGKGKCSIVPVDEGSYVYRELGRVVHFGNPVVTFEHVDEIKKVNNYDLESMLKALRGTIRDDCHWLPEHLGI